MDMSAVADWFTILFFLWYGLKNFIPVLNKGFLPTVEAMIAICTAVFIYLSP